MKMTLAFDADDTLWHNENHYLQAGEGFVKLLSSYQNPEHARRVLESTEIRNVARYGYGIKSYTLSMIEAAVDLTAGRISGREIGQILDIGRQMLSAEVVLLDRVQEVLAELAGDRDLMLITKGDLLEQATKLERSGLASFFHQVEVVSEKTVASYRRLLGRRGISPDRFMMVGNSLRSDILPVVKVGGRAVYIPYQLSWSYEADIGDELPENSYFELEHLGQLPALLHELGLGDDS